MGTDWQGPPPHTPPAMLQCAPVERSTRKCWCFPSIVCWPGCMDTAQCNLASNAPCSHTMGWAMDSEHTCIMDSVTGTRTPFTSSHITATCFSAASRLSLCNPEDNLKDSAQACTTVLPGPRCRNIHRPAWLSCYTAPPLTIQSCLTM